MSSADIWEGWYTCQVEGCEETIYLLRQEPGPEGWQAQVLHDHEQGGWIVAVFPHKKGQRYWAEVKRMREAIAQQRRDNRVAAEVRRDSRPQSSSRKSSRSTGRASTSAPSGAQSTVPSTQTGPPAPATTTPSDSSTATDARSTETSSILSSGQKESAFLRRLHSSRKSSSDE